MFTRLIASVVTPFPGYDITCNDGTKYSYAATKHLKELIHAAKIKMSSHPEISFVMSGGMVV
jgi:hypothetical protein